MALSHRDDVASAGVRLELSEALLWRVTLAVAACNLLLLLATTLYYTNTWALRTRSWVVDLVVIESNLGIERNVATWFSFATILIVAVMAFVCAAAVLQRHGRGSRLTATGWIAMAFLFLLLSFDELASIHERFSWRSLAVPMLIYGVGLAALTLHMKRVRAAAFWLAVLGVLLYLSVPLQEEVSQILRRGATEEWIRPTWHVVAEEGAEVFATLCFFAACGLYVLAQSQDATLTGRSQRTFVWLPQTTLRAGMMAAFAVLAVGAAFFEFAAPEGFTRSQILLKPWDDWGMPVNWFGATSALLAALISIQAWRIERGVRADEKRLDGAWILLATSVCCLLLSAAHGASSPISVAAERDDPFLSEVMLPGGPLAGDAARWTVILVAASLGTYLFFRARATEVRVGFLVWPALVGISLLADPNGASVLLVLGYGSLVLSLLPYLWSRTRPPAAGSLGRQLPTSKDDV